MNDGNVSLGRINGELANTRAKTGFGSQYCRTCHAVAASNEQCITHLTFVSKGVAWNKTAAYIVLFNDRIWSLYLLDTFLTETDIKYAQLSNELLVLRKEERQFRLLQGECQVSTNDIGSNVIGIVFSHQT